VSGRIKQCFGAAQQARRKVLIPFMTAGDPEPDWMVALMHSAVSAGADILELGVPFSDPMADGPVIQLASERAIEKGVDLTQVLEMVRAFRDKDQRTPVVLMGYLNPIERFGAERFASTAATAGVDGLLLVDCPPEEDAALHASLAQSRIDVIRLVAPTTTDDRMALLARGATGFMYYVSFKGITGANRLDASTLAAPLERLRRHTDLPVAVGFGISDGQAAAAVAPVADAVVVGSALVRLLAEAEDEATACERASGFVASLRQALDNGGP
jgi:tryptophan synthase alpha chain